MSYKTYENYEDSGIEWIGEIPEHWECRKINSLAFVRRGASPRPIDDPIYFDDNGVYSWVRISNVTSSNKYLDKTDEKLSSLGKSLSVPIEPGNIFVSIAGTVGKPIIANIKCCIHDGFVYFNNLKINDGFLFYVFEGKQAYKGLGKLGTQLNLNTETIGKIHIPVPSEKEQTLIENFLDRKTSEIDKNIAKNKELISLLDEKKVALINHAVTKGLDPDVPMKDSGIEWIGEIPEHWAVIPLKRACSKITDGSHHSPETQYEGKYYITVKDVLEKEINFENANKISIDDFNDLKNNSCQPLKGDVLLSKDGTIGKCVVVDYNDFVILSSLGLLRPNILINSNYLRYFLISDINIKQMFSFIRGSALKRLTINIIKELEIILPSLQEQEQIIDYLDKETSKIDKSIKKLENNISLLEEYKDSLIHHAVTGKIDVRDEI